MAVSSSKTEYVLLAQLPGRLRVSLRDGQQQMLANHWELVSTVREPCLFLIARFLVPDGEFLVFRNLLRNLIGSFSQLYNGLYCSLEGVSTFNNCLGARLAGGVCDIEDLRKLLKNGMEKYMYLKDHDLVPHVVLFDQVAEVNSGYVNSIVQSYHDMFFGGGVIHQFELKRVVPQVDQNDVLSVYVI